MLKRSVAAISTSALAVCITLQSALAQRPPSGNQAPAEFSLSRAWAWLMARPGAMIALAIIVVAIVYMVLSKKKSKT